MYCTGHNESILSQFDNYITEPPGPNSTRIRSWIISTENIFNRKNIKIQINLSCSKDQVEGPIFIECDWNINVLVARNSKNKIRTCTGLIGVRWGYRRHCPTLSCAKNRPRVLRIDHRYGLNGYKVHSRVKSIIQLSNYKHDN